MTRIDYPELDETLCTQTLPNGLTVCVVPRQGFTKSLARELGRNRITVNAVAPGFISTAMTNAIPEDRRNELKEQLALRRFGEPEEVADLILFLASDKARYITGQTIFIDGGF